MDRVASCACGAVRVAVTGEPQICWVCHCDHCQNQEKWPGSERYFCSTCGTNVHWKNPAAFPGMRMISIGCFADPGFPGPKLAMQTKHRHR